MPDLSQPRFQWQDNNELPLAVFSADRMYRYELWRRWDLNEPYAMFIGLNPSTADETNDDPTIRRCIRFTKDWGFGALCMTNLFAFRATDPKVMKKADDPIGPDNDHTLLRLAAGAGIIVAAWGNHGAYKNRDAEVALLINDMVGTINCFGLTKTGSPLHPLYLPSSSVLQKY